MTAEGANENYRERMREGGGNEGAADVEEGMPWGPYWSEGKSSVSDGERRRSMWHKLLPG